jgi:hypothetical protein
MSECCEREVNQLLAKAFFYVFNAICYPNSFQYNREALQTALKTNVSRPRQHPFPLIRSGGLFLILIGLTMVIVFVYPACFSDAWIRPGCGTTITAVPAIQS